MSDRRPYLAANWKMHKTRPEASEFIEHLAPLVQEIDADVVVCPPFTALSVAVGAATAGIKIFAQNMHESPDGAYTGEISAPMLNELNVQGVVLGHSERRQYYNEQDSALQAKVVAALGAGLEPILCVGESEEERDGGDMERRLRHQVQEDLDKVSDEQLPSVVIAYEPIWAIGTGRAATPEDAQEAISFIRALIADRSAEAASQVRILYGGSVKPENAREILSQPDVDGALVGGAALEAASFGEIVKAAV